MKKYDTTVCTNYFDENHRARSLQDRVYYGGGISTAITTSFLPSVMIWKTDNAYNPET